MAGIFVSTRRSPATPAAVFAVAAGLAFVFVRPPVGDLWGARARASAAAHGVGLRYWFSWFGGTVPGHYSVLAPYLSRIADVDVLGAVATVAITPLVHLLVRGCPHPVLATWLAAIGSAISLWSGRVPFAEGMAVALTALLLVRRRRPVLAAPVAVVAALVSPVAAAFLMLGLIGVVFHDPARRVAAAVTGGAAGACLLTIAVLFGTPGPEGFAPIQVLGTMAAFGALLCARPRAEVRTVLVVALVACPFIAVIPNGLGSNFERFAWLCMPIATAATATAGRRLVLAATVAALAMTSIQSTKDLVVASRPMSSASYYDGLIGAVDRTAGLDNYRVEVVPDGTHVAAYALLGHASLARGYETQSDNQLNAILESPGLDAASYRDWLDSYAVRYVAIDSSTLQSGPEDQLVRNATPPYLHKTWSDAHWTLYEVTRPVPIVAAPARVVDADQSELVVATPRATTVGLRLRWSQFLRVHGPAGTDASLVHDASGFSRLTTSGPGRYVIDA